ncbi:MAG: T9SS type A sorting domain-containing protein [Bacteroidota bacterium]|nr:T9SS type A sorting domain-containing protein [Bacteroidota bacterium]
MKNLKLYFSIITISLISFQNIYSYEIIPLNNDGSSQFLPASAKSKYNFTDNGTIIGWFDEEKDGSLCAQKLNMTGVKQWSDEGLTIDINLGSGFTADDDYPQIFSDNKGGAIIIYTKAFYSSKEIYMQKILADGNYLRDPVCLSSKFGGYNFSPSAVMAGNDYIAVSWENFNGGDFNIHAQMIDLNGNIIWNEGEEVEVCDFRFDQRKPTIACDEDNNIYVTWLDTRDSEYQEEFAFNLYATVLTQKGECLEYGTKGKLIFGDDFKSKKYSSKNFDSQGYNDRKEMFFNHNLISSSGNSIIVSVERSNNEDDSYIKIFKLNKNLENIWEKVIDDFYYQTNPLIISDNNKGVNVFWTDQRNEGREIYNMALDKDGVIFSGGERGEIMSCDNMKPSCIRVMPSQKNQNGIHYSKNKIFFTWVNTSNDKLYLSNLNLIDESNNCGNAIELLDGVTEGEYTSITTQNEDLVIVFRQSNSIFALVKEKNDNSSNDAHQKTLITNFPNPFNPATKIYFKIPSDGFVRLSVFDIAGRKIKTFISDFRKSGAYEVTFDGSNLSSGIYFYRLETNGFIQTKKMTLIK